MVYNAKSTNANELFELLRSLSKYVDQEIRMYALGGTALTILGIKESTLDIDIDVHSSAEYKRLCLLFEQIGFKRIGTIRWQTQEGLFFDLFQGSNILGTALQSDYMTKSKFIRAFGNVKLYTFCLDDIIISKLARGDMRDFEDIKAIFESNNIDLDKLIARYKVTMEFSAVAMYQQKLLDLIEINFKKWGYKVNKRVITEVKK
jgi:hypothetical protein